MALVEQDLRSQVLRGSTEGKGSIFDDFGKPEISQFDIAVLTDQNVFWLKIPIDDVL